MFVHHIKLSLFKQRISYEYTFYNAYLNVHILLYLYTQYEFVYFRIYTKNISVFFLEQHSIKKKKPFRTACNNRIYVCVLTEISQIRFKSKNYLP